jgi:2-polyprenyl-3-methyl-5-hydroxy-6-metoxy-1,4-benzoquinol methylase
VPEIWGTDLSTNMLKVASVLPFKHLIAGDLNQCLHSPLINPHSPLARLPAGYFDAVVCVGTCEFVRDFSHFMGQVSHFLRPGGLFIGTFPSNQTRTYSSMSWITVERLVGITERSNMDVVEIQQYRGWSVSADEHVEYIQLCARSR